MPLRIFSLRRRCCSFLFCLVCEISSTEIIPLVKCILFRLLFWIQACLKPSKETSVEMGPFKFMMIFQEFEVMNLLEIHETCLTICRE